MFCRCKSSTFCVRAQGHVSTESTRWCNKHRDDNLDEVVVRKKGDTHALDNICDLAGHVAVRLQLPCGGESDSPSAGSRPDYAGRKSDFRTQHSGLTQQAFGIF
jgi:hypothetical protein